MIVGVGIDVVDAARFAEALERTPGLRRRLFTEDEQALPPLSLAARFAVKEAAAKALGAPVGLRWADAWVRKDGDGRPHLVVQGTVAARAAELGVDRWHVSMSHDAGIASAVVIAESSAVVIAESSAVGTAESSAVGTAESSAVGTAESSGGPVGAAGEGSDG